MLCYSIIYLLRSNTFMNCLFDDVRELIFSNGSIVRVWGIIVGGKLAFRRKIQ